MTIRAACAVKDGRSLLLFETPTPGELSLTNFLVSRGWTFVADKATCFPSRATGRITIGHEVGRGHGNSIHVVHTSTVDCIVFVKRDNVQAGSAHLGPVERDEARRRLYADMVSFRLPFYEEPLATIDSLVQAHVYELIYSDIDGAIELLEQLLRRFPGLRGNS